MPNYPSFKTTPNSSADWRLDLWDNEETERYDVTDVEGNVRKVVREPYKSKWRKRKDARYQNQLDFVNGKQTPATEMMKENNINPVFKPIIRTPEYKQKKITVGEKRTLFYDAWYGDKGRRLGYIHIKTISKHKKEEKKEKKKPNLPKEEGEKKKKVEEVKISLSEIEAMKIRRQKEREVRRIQRYANIKDSFEQYLIDKRVPIPLDFRSNWKTIEQLKEEEEKEKIESNVTCEMRQAALRKNWRKEKDNKK